MDLNPLFTGAKSFRPGGPSGGGGELKLFEQVGIELVHGWLVDPESPEAAVLAKTEDYDSAVNLIVDADHITNGQLVVNEDDYADATPQAGSSSHGASGSGSASRKGNWTEEERSKVEDGKSEMLSCCGF